MSPLVRLIRNYPISSFAVLACAFGWMVYGLAAVGIGSNPENMPLGPCMAAFVVTACQGREAFFEWGRRLRNWRAAPWLYAVAIITPIAVHVSIVAINLLFGAPMPTSDQLSEWPQIPITFLVMLVMVGLGEEAGWTAFAAPILLRRHGLWGAWVILGALRIFWHLPLLISGDMPWMVWLVGNGAFQLVVLQLMRRSNGAWSLAAVWHATLNAFGGAFFFSMVDGADKERLGTLLALSYAVLALISLIPAVGGRRGTSELDPPLAFPHDAADESGVRREGRLGDPGLPTVEAAGREARVRVHDGGRTRESR